MKFHAHLRYYVNNNNQVHLISTFSNLCKNIQVQIIQYLYTNQWNFSGLVKSSLTRLLLHLCWPFFSTYIRIWTFWQDTHSLGPSGGAYLSPPLWALDDGSPPLLDRIVPTSLWTRRPSTPFAHLTINRWNWQRNKVKYEVCFLMK